MATEESAATDGSDFGLRAASGPAIGALAAWLAIDVAVDPGGWAAGGAVAAVGFLPLVGVALRRRAAFVAAGAVGAVAVLSGITVVRGGTPSTPLLAVMALCGAFLVGFGYALAGSGASPAAG